MKLKLNSLRAVECGPLEDVQIDFVSSGDNAVTVLAGANGSGKTTALEIIAALFDLIPHYPFIWSPPSEHSVYLGYSSEQFRRTEGVLKRVGLATLEMSIGDQRIRFGYSATDPGADAGTDDLLIFPLQGGRLGHHGSKYSGVVHDWEYKIKAAEQKILPFIFADKRLDDSSQYLPSILFFPAHRTIMAEQGEQIRRGDIKYRWVYWYDNPTDFHASIDSYLVWLDYASPNEYSRVINFLDSLDIDGKRFGVLRKELRGLVTTRDGRQHFLDYLSSGEQHLVVALLQLARRLTPNSIVLIDELENALHPAYQFLFAESLKRMQTVIPFQLIVTTHAPAVVEAFGYRSVRLLSGF